MKKKLTIPSDWRSDFLGNLASISTGSKNTQDKVDDGDYPFFVRSQTIEKINSYSYDGEAVLTAGDGVGTGKVFHHVNGKFDFHQRVYKISDFKNSLLPSYFFEYFRKNFIRQVVKYTAKTSVDSVRMEMLTQMEIPLPPLEEQKKIAQILSTWDEAIEAVNELIEKKKKLFRTLLFTKLRAKSEPNYKIRDIGKIKHGKSQKKVENDSGKYPVLATGGVIGYANDYLTNKPSVLIGRKGTIDKPGYMDEPFWHVDTLFRIETKVELVIPKWLYFYFLTINWQAYNQGAVLPSLTGSTVESIKLFVPDLATQQDHVSMLNGLENQIELLVKKKELLLQQKKGLMQQLLTGKTRIS